MKNFIKTILKIIFAPFLWIYRLLYKNIPFMRNSRLFKNIHFYYNMWVYIPIDMYRVHSIPEGFAKDKKNIERAMHNLELLADKKSKKLYKGMIRLRQTFKKQHYPFHWIAEDEYFFRALKFADGEVFVDCGAYIGDTIDQFIEHCPNYSRIIAFEPDNEHFEVLKNKYQKCEKIELFNAGVYDTETSVSFMRGLDVASHIGSSGGGIATTIQTMTIDGLNLDKVTFLKMDIEGAEMKALKGAEKTIIKYKPKLAICLYHTDSDMVEIIEYIHSIVPSYKLYVRQYKLISGTVLYAVPETKDDSKNTD